MNDNAAIHETQQAAISTELRQSGGRLYSRDSVSIKIPGNSLHRGGNIDLKINNVKYISLYSNCIQSDSHRDMSEREKKH